MKQHVHYAAHTQLQAYKHVAQSEQCYAFLFNLNSGLTVPAYPTHHVAKLSLWKWAALGRHRRHLKLARELAASSFYETKNRELRKYSS
jgi:hypothetical protein